MLGLQKKKREPAPYRYREVTYKIKISLNTRHIGRKGRARPVRLASAVGLDPVFMFGLETLTTLLLDRFPFFFLFFFPCSEIRAKLFVSFFVVPPHHCH